MKKLFLLTFLFSTSAFSQTTWFSLNSGTTKTINCVTFINSNLGFVCGDSGLILKTTNGGSSWNSQIPGNLGSNVQLMSLFFFDESTGCIAGQKDHANWGYILKTTDGGLNWFSVSFFSGNAMKGISFSSGVTGYVVGYTNIFKSINGGNSWSSQFNNNNLFFEDVRFINNNTGVSVGYINGSNGIIYKTTNGGIAWNPITSPSPQQNYSLQFVNDSIGYISCGGGKILKTTNQGNNWNVLSVLGTLDNFNSLYFTSVNDGFAVGTGSTIVKTTDGGLNWEANSSPSNEELMSTYFVNGNTGYAVGGGGTIIKTTNGGGLGYPNIKINLKIILEGFYFPLFNIVSRKDSVTLLLRDISSPYSIIDSSKNLVDSLTFSSIFQFSNISSGLYYLVAKHFNSIETWSRAGGEPIYNIPITNNYDFTSLITQAYGSNMKLKGSKYCVYSGDVDQSEFIDVTDIILIFNDASTLSSGRFLPSDLNGDNFVDSDDLIICFNNLKNLVGVIRP